MDYLLFTVFGDRTSGPVRRPGLPERAAIECVVKRIQRLKSVKRLGSDYRLQTNIAIDVPFVDFMNEEYIPEVKITGLWMGNPGVQPKLLLSRGWAPYHRK
jgi:hypothetical protein